MGLRETISICIRVGKKISSTCIMLSGLSEADGGITPTDPSPVRTG